MCFQRDFMKLFGKRLDVSDEYIITVERNHTIDDLKALMRHVTYNVMQKK